MVTLKQVEDGYEVVAPDGTVIGYVYRAPDQAWSYAPWVIDGVHTNVKGGVIRFPAVASRSRSSGTSRAASKARDFFTAITPSVRQSRSSR